MEKSNAISTLSALAQNTRLSVFRLLVVAGPDGMKAGDISTALGAPANTISTNLSILNAAGLVRAQREGRVIRYFARIEGMVLLMSDLMRDCCRGNPDLCLPLMTQPRDRPCPQKDAP
ncbi:helix-turn-helix transcriptional regulator [Paracoccus nototheniae]|uniref:ArsR/SmtB family transcription factor n=1 Tax=Paracoccus nototheniae TaxID=2489002 RepID=A0ABW4DQP7_9RHOB|nr:metalloregulator ArsR/SmtB family transcription factor [Paracoccus nototheniae]